MTGRRKSTRGTSLPKPDPIPKLKKGKEKELPTPVQTIEERPEGELPAGPERFEAPPVGDENAGEGVEAGEQPKSKKHRKRRVKTLEDYFPPETDLNQPLYKPHGKWGFTTGKDFDDVLAIKKLSHGAQAEVWYNSGSVDGKHFDYIAKKWSVWNEWRGFFAEIYLYASSKHLRPLQGDVVPFFIGIHNVLGGYVSFAMEPFCEEGWNEAHPHMPHETKLLVVQAFEKLHRQGVLHNDVELRHMLISADRKRVQLIDFQESRSLNPCDDVGLGPCTQEELDAEMEKVKNMIDFSGEDTAAQIKWNRRHRNYVRDVGRQRKDGTWEEPECGKRHLPHWYWDFNPEEPISDDEPDPADENLEWEHDYDEEDFLKSPLVPDPPTFGRRFNVPDAAFRQSRINERKELDNLVEAQRKYRLDMEAKEASQRAPEADPLAEAAAHADDPAANDVVPDKDKGKKRELESPRYEDKAHPEELTADPSVPRAVAKRGSEELGDEERPGKKRRRRLAPRARNQAQDDDEDEPPPPTDEVDGTSKQFAAANDHSPTNGATAGLRRQTSPVPPAAARSPPIRRKGRGRAHDTAVLGKGEADEPDEPDAPPAPQGRSKRASEESSDDEASGRQKTKRLKLALEEQPRRSSRIAKVEQSRLVNASVKRATKALGTKGTATAAGPRATKTLRGRQKEDQVLPEAAPTERRRSSRSKQTVDPAPGPSAGTVAGKPAASAAKGVSGGKRRREAPIPDGRPPPERKTRPAAEPAPKPKASKAKA